MKSLYSASRSKKMVFASRTFVLPVVVLLVFTACSSAPKDGGKTPETTAAASATASAPTPTPTPASEFGKSVTNDHGNLVKTVGQLSGLSLSETDSTVIARFVITGFQIDPACQDYSQPPKNGHYLEIQMNVETAPELAKSTQPTVSFSEYFWQAYDSANKRLNDPVGNGYSCLDSSKLLPSQIGPGQSISGSVLLDVADTTGTVALVMGQTGWEWRYPLEG